MPDNGSHPGSLRNPSISEEKNSTSSGFKAPSIHRYPSTAHWIRCFSVSCYMIRSLHRNISLRFSDFSQVSNFPFAGRFQSKLYNGINKLKNIFLQLVCVFLKKLLLSIKLLVFLYVFCCHVLSMSFLSFFENGLLSMRKEDILNVVPRGLTDRQREENLKRRFLTITDIGSES